MQIMKKTRLRLVTVLVFFSATTTPTHPYSSADLIGSYNEAHSARLSSSDDVRLSSGTLLPDTEQRNNKHKLYKDANTGPLSANILTHSNSRSGRRDRKNFIITSREKGTTTFIFNKQWNLLLRYGSE